MKRLSLDTLINTAAAGDPLDQMIQGSHPAAASRVGRAALLRLQSRLDDADDAEVALLVRVVEAFRSASIIAADEPDTTLRLCSSLYPRPGSHHDFDQTGEQCAEHYTRAEAAFAEQRWHDARRELAVGLGANGTEDVILRARCVLLLMRIHHNQGEFEQELALWRAMEPILPRLECMEHSEALLAKGNVLTELRRFADAESAYDEALKMVADHRPQPIGHESNLIVNRANARHVQMDRSRPDRWQDIRAQYKQAYKLLLRAGHVDQAGGLRADRLVNIAWTYSKEAEATRDPIVRRRLLRACGLVARLALYHNARGPSEQPERREAHILGTLCRALEARGDLDVASGYHRRAVALADAQPDRPDIRWDSRWSFAEFCVRNRRWSDAEKIATEAHVLSELERAQREQREGRGGLSRANARIYRTLVDAELGRRGTDGARLAHVYRWMEMAKARTSLDAVAGVLVGSRHRAIAASPVSYRRITEGLAPGAWLLEYFCTETTALVLAVSRHGGGLVRLDMSPRELMDQATDASRRARESGLSRATLSALSTIVAPVMERIREDVTHVIIVPHGSLHALPFGGLIVEDQYLVQRCAVTHAPSASVWHRSSRQRRPSGSQFLGVGVSDNIARTAEDEVTRIVRSMRSRGHRADALLGDAATLARLRTQASHAHTIHFACHGWSAGDPLESSLQLYGDESLTVRDLLADRGLRASHVVMHACVSGAEDVDIGEEHMGLVTGFLQAGASAVVGTLTPTIDRTGPDFAIAYYDGIDRGMTSAAALRHAQLEFLRSDPAYRRDPMFWAPYYTTGM